MMSSLHLDCSERGKEYEGENRNKTHMENSRTRGKINTLIADLHTSPPTSGAGSRISHEGQEDYLNYINSDFHVLLFFQFQYNCN